MFIKNSFCRNSQFTCFSIYYIFIENAANQFVFQHFKSLTWRCSQTSTFTNEIDTYNVTIVLTNDNVLRYVNKTTSQITRVSCTKCCIGQTFTSTMRGRKVIQYSQTFFKVCLDWQVDDTTRWVSHQTTHTSKLTNLLFVTTGTGDSHHIYRVEAIFIARHIIHHGISNIFCCFCPQLDSFTITFFFCNKTTAI